MTLTRNQAKLIRKLGSRKQREKTGLFLVEGVRVVEELAAAGSGVELVVTAAGLADTLRGRRLLELVARQDWPVAEITDRELDRLADTESPQGVLAVVRKREWRRDELEIDADSVVVVFDGVGDPGNLGTLLRTAHGLGVAVVVTLPGTVDPWNPKAVRASAGSILRIPVIQAAWPEVVVWLRASGLPILCAVPDGERVRRGLGAEGRGFALVLGNEAAGPSERVLAEADRRVAVELAAGVDSLNVAIAGALLLDRLVSARDEP